MSKLQKLWPLARARAGREMTSAKGRAGRATGLLLAMAALTAPMAAKADNGLRVETKQGVVEGFVANDVAEFLGIPYGRATGPQPMTFSLSIRRMRGSC